MIRIVLLAIACACLLGCSSGETWARVEAERRRIATEWGPRVPAAERDAFLTTVYDRPRTKPESIVSGYELAVSRVNRERLALAEFEDGIRKVDETHAQTGNAWPHPRNREDAVSVVPKWKDEIRNAQRMLLVAEASQRIEDWLPTLDIILDGEFQASRSGIRSRRPTPANELRHDRGLSWFIDWRQKFQKVQQP